MAKGFTISEKSIEYLRLLPKEDAGELLHALIDTYLAGEKQDYQGTEKHLYWELYQDILTALDKRRSKSRSAAKAAEKRWENHAAPSKAEARPDMPNPINAYQRGKEHAGASESMKDHAETCENMPVYDTACENMQVNDTACERIGETHIDA